MDKTGISSAEKVGMTWGDAFWDWCGKDLSICIRGMFQENNHGPSCIM